MKENKKNVRVVLIILATIVIFGLFVVSGSIGGEDTENYVSTFDIYESVSDKDGESTSIYAKVSIQVPYEYKDIISEQALESEAMVIVRSTPKEVFDSADGLSQLKANIKDSISLPEEINKDEVKVYISDYAAGLNAMQAKERAQQNPNAGKRQVIMENLFQGLKKNDN